MAKVTVIGSGNVGANAAFFIAEKAVSDVALYDINQGLAAGKALDMMEAAPLRGYRHRIDSIDALPDLAGSAVVVLAAGTVRSSQIAAAEWVEHNRQVAEEMGAEIAKWAPDAVVVVTTEPVDLMTECLVETAGIARERVLGVGGLLDATRFRYAVARELKLSMDNVTSLVIGRHDERMLILDRYTRVSGVPLGQLMSAERVAALQEETRRAGALVMEMTELASAYYAPSAAVAEMVASVVCDLHRILPVSVMLDGEYGLRQVALSLPCVVGSRGVERVLMPQLSADEHQRLIGSVSGGRPS